LKFAFTVPNQVLQDFVACLILPHLAYLIFDRPIVTYTTLSHTLEVAKSINKSELQLNLQKHINLCCCSFNKILVKRKSYTARQCQPTDKF